MKDRLEGYITEALGELGITGVDFTLEHPADMAHGDWATNVAMVALAKNREVVAKEKNDGVRPRDIGLHRGRIIDGVLHNWRNPRELAELIKKSVLAKNDSNITSLEVAGPGFINFKIAPTVFDKELEHAISEGEKWGRNDTLKGKKVMVEYTDPNPFKEFHIGHLMSNAIGESISRLVEASGAEVSRACYQGDIGLHVAKELWEADNRGWTTIGDVAPSAAAYIAGAIAYEEDEIAKKEIDELNKKIYARSEAKINQLYDSGKKVSLEYFETIYKRLGTKFDHFFFESETGETGKKVVAENKGKVFEESEGAVVFHAEKFNPKLHTRVFINKDGLPTYEAKELGLAKTKFEKFPYDTSIVVTGNEVNDYFLVLLEAMRQIFPDLAAKTEHYSHGMLRLPTGKMSSRTGDVITAVDLIDKARVALHQKINPNIVIYEQRDKLADEVAVGAIKYSILRQAAGRDIIFDFDQSLSFEGDSGPYLQYTHARTCSVLEKAGSKADQGQPFNPNPSASSGQVSQGSPFADSPLPRLLARFPEIVHRASWEREPHYVANYLIEIAREFNSFYGNMQILDGASNQPYKLALTKAVGLTLKNVLWLLGIAAPSKM